MKFGLSSLYLINKPFRTLVNAIENSDVKYWEIADEDLTRLDNERIKLLNEIKSTRSLEYTVHAPFADTNIASFNQAVKQLVMKQLESSLRHAHLLESSLWIIHPGMHSGLTAIHPNEDFRINLKSLEYLAKKADDMGIKLAVENMPEPFPWLFKKVSEFEEFYRELGSEDIGIAFDAGHANTAGQIDDFLKHFANKIIHVHASDNDGTFDNHLPIGQGTINWKKIIDKLARNKFKGFIMVETLNDPMLDLKKLCSFYSE